MGVRISAKFLPPARRLKVRQEVAAVCYRVGGRGIEFLLVQTRGGRWIFPKGGVERGLTRAQSAALEAFEEAGVHGRIEAAAFARYFKSGRIPPFATKNQRADARSAEEESSVSAYLCEVTRLEPPQESNRKPTWFSAEKTKQRLLKNREPEFGAELVRVVDRAAARIRRLHGGSAHPRGHTQPAPGKKEALQEVHFDAFEIARRHGLAAAYARHLDHEYADDRSAASPPFASNRPTLRLQGGTASERSLLQKVQFIDDARPANGSKAPAKSPRSRGQ